MSVSKQSSVSEVYHVVRRFVKEEWGGTESVVYNLAKEYERKGILSPVLSTDMLSQAGQEDMGPVEVRRFPFIFPWFGLDAVAQKQLELKGGSPLCLQMFRFLKKQKNISIIHTHTEHRLGGIARTIARKKGIPYVVTLHGGVLTLPDDQVEIMKEPFKGKFEWGKAFGALWGARKVLQDADAIICVGKDEYELMKKRFPEKEVVYQANGVATEFFRNADASEFRQKFGIAEQTKLLVNVSRIDPQKNQLLLLRAFARYLEQQADTKLVLIGPVSVRDYHQQLLDEAKSLGIDQNLIFVEGLKPDDSMLASAYKAADVFVLPSRHEPFGIVILEAWAAGTPVVAANVGGIPGFTHNNEDVLLFKDNDEDELLQKLETLLGDEDLQEGLKSRASEEVNKYDWAEIASQTLRLYEKLIDKKSKK